MMDNLGKGQSNPVVHKVKISKWTLPSAYPSTRYYPWNSPAGYYSVPNAGPSWASDIIFGWCSGYDTYSLSTIGSLPARWSVASGSINESSLQNDVIDKAKGLQADVMLDLVEGNQVWPSIRSLATCLPEMGANWKNLRKFIKTASGGFLAWKFGVSPILSDIQAITRYMPKIAKDLKRHSESGPHSYSRSARLIASYDSSDRVVESQAGIPVSVVQSQGIPIKEPEIRYVLVVEPTTRYHTDFFKKLDLAMSRFATSPASLAWEKIPFSFVVDWFVDLRGSLNALDKAIGFQPFEIKSFTRSFSYHLETDMFAISRAQCTGGPTFLNQRCGNLEFKHYERSLVPGSTQKLTWKPRFGKNQAGISAALISQQLSKLH
jgi:hypothetical protein